MDWQTGKIPHGTWVIAQWEDERGFGGMTPPGPALMADDGSCWSIEMSLYNGMPTCVFRGRDVEPFHWKVMHG